MSIGVRHVELASETPMTCRNEGARSISMAAFLCTLGFVLIEAAVTIHEGTFLPWSYREVALPFVWHGGAIYDLLFFPVLNGLAWPYLRFRPVPTALFVMMGAVSTIGFHIAWYSGNSGAGSPDWVWPAHTTGSWIRDMGIAGWMHCVFMAAESALFLTFVVSPVPRATVRWIAIGLTPFPLFGAILPSLVVNGRVDSLAIATAVSVLVSTWLIAGAKIRSAGGGVLAAG